ncbi:GNAT family N-acetyltransferase [Thermodesulfatator atlanticus]
MKLREAEERDFDFICDASKEFMIFGPYDEIIPSWFRDPWIKCLVLEEESELLGFIMLGPMFLPLWQRTLDVTAIYVKPTLRKRGLGLSLVKEAEVIARKKGYRYLRAHVGQENKPAFELFKKAGFSIKKKIENYYPSGLTAIEMLKELRGRKEQ